MKPIFFFLLPFAACLSWGSCMSSIGPASDQQSPVSLDHGGRSIPKQSTYPIEIIGASLCKDYEGKSAIRITYHWTNNSYETTSPADSMCSQAFQNGVEMDLALVNFEDDIPSDVKPGSTIQVDEIFLLQNHSNVEFHIYAIEDMFFRPIPKTTAIFDLSALK